MTAAAAIAATDAAFEAAAEMAPALMSAETR